MAKKTTNFILGLFVILGFVLGVAAIIWVGASTYFQKGETYISYFNESVEGLQQDSSVKYRGVDVGRVINIRVAPDNKLIGVIMKINLRGDLSKTVVAQLVSAGITGVKFIGLDRSTPEEIAQSPKITFPSEYPMIPSRPSEIQRLITSATAIMEKFQQIDTKAISDQVVVTTKAIETFFQGRQMTATMAKLGGTAGNLEKFTGDLNKSVNAKNMNAIIGGTQNSLKEINALLASIQDDLKAMKLPETISRYRTVARDVENLSNSLKDASATLEKFLERIYDRPPDLLFGKPPPKRWNE